MMLKLTPNSVKRPKGVPLQFEKSMDGLYVVKNAYQGHYEYFKDRPLHPLQGRGEEVYVSPKSLTKVK